MYKLTILNEIFSNLIFKLNIPNIGTKISHLRYSNNSVPNFVLYIYNKYFGALHELLPVTCANTQYNQKTTHQKDISYIKKVCAKLLP